MVMMVSPVTTKGCPAAARTVVVPFGRLMTLVTRVTGVHCGLPWEATKTPVVDPVVVPRPLAPDTLAVVPEVPMRPPTLDGVVELIPAQSWPITVTPERHRAALARTTLLLPLPA